MMNITGIIIPRLLFIINRSARLFGQNIYGGINMDEMVTIKKEEYEKLKKDSEFLSALLAAGVDNWDGYDYAVEQLSE